MKKMGNHDFKATVSLTNSEFDIEATGNHIDILTGLILAVATLGKDLKKDDVTDKELEASFVNEYRRALAYAKEHAEAGEFSINYIKNAPYEY